MTERRLTDGSAAEVFARMVAALGGPHDLLESHPIHLPRAPHAADVETEEGVVLAVDARAIGLAVIELGGGRTRADQAIDHRVGFSRFAPIGAAVGPHRPLCVVHAADPAAADRAADRLRSAVTIRPDPHPLPTAVVGERITAPN
jgi:thymidine phosphorylase